MSGRPTVYTPEIAEKILGRIAAGDTLRSICRDDYLPCRDTVNEWRRWNHDGFSDRYAQARESQAEVYFDEVIDLARECPPVSDYVQQTRMTIDSIKWRLARQNAAKYGDRSALDLGGQPNNPIQTRQAIAVESLTDEQREQLGKIGRDLMQGDGK